MTPAGTTEPTSPRAALRLTKIGTKATAWAFAFLVLRIFAVSGYDWSTAFKVSSTINLSEGPALLFGSLMAAHDLMAVLLILMVPLFIATYIWTPRGRRPVVMLAGAVHLVALASHVLSFASWWILPGAALVLILFWFVHRLSPEHRLHRVLTAAMTRVGSIAAVAVLLVAALTHTPWVPREDIDTSDGTITGYVLSVDSGYLNVLTTDHEFVIIIGSDVISRD